MSSGSIFRVAQRQACTLSLLSHAKPTGQPAVCPSFTGPTVASFLPTCGITSPNITVASLAELGREPIHAPTAPPPLLYHPPWLLIIAAFCGFSGTKPDNQRSLYYIFNLESAIQ